MLRTTCAALQLFAEAKVSADNIATWHFRLEAAGGTLQLEVSEEEAHAALDRLELLAVVRGLEAIDQPSRVSLLTPSRAVIHGFRFGLAQWRESNWRWESFGQMIPIKNEDLWRRVDQALTIHRVVSRLYRCDEAAATAVPKPAFARRMAADKVSLPERREVRRHRSSAWQSLRQHVAGALVGLGQAIAPGGNPVVAS